MSSIEYEAKILNINKEFARERLKEAGAVKTSNYTFRRYVFDTIPAVPNRWVRLRSDGQATTLAIKEINSDAIDGTDEWEVSVSDIDQTLRILEKIGIMPRGYQENTREEYDLDSAQVSIDCWPGLDPYLEIEASSTKEVIRVAKLLGYTSQQLTAENTEALYKNIGVNLKKTARLTFD